MKKLFTPTVNSLIRKLLLMAAMGLCTKYASVEWGTAIMAAVTGILSQWSKIDDTGIATEAAK